MSDFFSKNLKCLRKQVGKTQEEVASDLRIKRPTYSGYENNVAFPNIEALLALSEYFNISIDLLLKKELDILTQEELKKLLQDSQYTKGNKLRVLATTVDSDNNENIELVHLKASAGYTKGFADPEFIKVLPTFQMPFLSKDKKYRTFQISGDSMLPIPDKSYVTGEFVQNWHMIRNRQPYIVVTLNEGIMFKILENQIETTQKLILHSLNPLYEPYAIHVNEVTEVWKFVHYISSALPEPNLPAPIIDTINKLHKEVEIIRQNIGYQYSLFEN